jgi:hypothetical protein
VSQSASRLLASSPSRHSVCRGVVVHRRFKKLYDDYRPGFMHWKLVLLARKFAMAVVAIMLDSNPLFQVRHES